MTIAYLVIDETAGLSRVLLDGQHAHRVAKACGQVVVEVPIAADYRAAARPRSETGTRTPTDGSRGRCPAD